MFLNVPHVKEWQGREGLIAVLDIIITQLRMTIDLLYIKKNMCQYDYIIHSWKRGLNICVFK